MMGGLKLDLCMIPWLKNIGPRDSDACREKSNIVGAKWMGQSGIKWNITMCTDRFTLPQQAWQDEMMLIYICTVFHFAPALRIRGNVEHHFQVNGI